jgi:hypothetical protein
MLPCIPPGLSCYPQTLNGPQQDSSVQNEEAVGLEPYILCDPEPGLPSLTVQSIIHMFFGSSCPQRGYSLPSNLVLAFRSPPNCLRFNEVPLHWFAA